MSTDLKPVIDSVSVVELSEIVTCIDVYWYQACWWPGDMQSLRPDAVASILANGSAAFLKAVLPLVEKLATTSDRFSQTGPMSSAGMVLT